MPRYIVAIDSMGWPPARPWRVLDTETGDCARQSDAHPRFRVINDYDPMIHFQTPDQAARLADKLNRRVVQP